MKYVIDFNDKAAADFYVRITGCFDRTEQYFKAKDLPRNIRGATEFCETVSLLRVLGADVDAHGIYNDGGYDRIGYARINGYEFVKNGEFDYIKLGKALHEIADEKKATE